MHFLTEMVNKPVFPAAEEERAQGLFSRTTYKKTAKPHFFLENPFILTFLVHILALAFQNTQSRSFTMCFLTYYVCFSKAK